MSEIPLSNFHLRINDLLTQPHISYELNHTGANARAARSSNINHLTEVPAFRFVLDYCIALYDPAGAKVHTGRWNENHEALVKRIAGSIGLKVFYTSGNYWQLRGAPEIKVFATDTPDHFSYIDLKFVQHRGYVVMDDEYNWLVLKSEKEKEVLKIPSTLVRR
jgi:hypothetical protein